jgi:hypothetical protein
LAEAATTTSFRGRGAPPKGQENCLALSRIPTEGGEGFMFYGDERIQVDVFAYNFSEIGD